MVTPKGHLASGGTAECVNFMEESTQRHRYRRGTAQGAESGRLSAFGWRLWEDS
jgi:hypothetical protein